MPPGSTSDALGLFQLVAGVAMLVSASAAATGKLVPAAVLATTALRFATVGAYQLTASSSWKHVAGIIGLCLCALSIYAALAMALEDAARKTRLPLGRRGAGRLLAHRRAERSSRVDRARGRRARAAPTLTSPLCTPVASDGRSRA